LEGAEQFISNNKNPGVTPGFSLPLRFQFLALPFLAQWIRSPQSEPRSPMLVPLGF
jgi:hypothetical protein